MSLRYVRGEEVTEEKKESTWESASKVVALIFIITLLAIAPAVVIAVWRELL